MRKHIYGLIAAATALLSSCETLQIQDESVQPELNKQEKVTLRASIGTDTKTYLEQESSQIYKVRWDDHDEFLVLDKNFDFLNNEDYDGHYGWFEIESGAGESEAEFVLTEGCLPERYMAIYGAVEPDVELHKWMLYIRPTQYYYLRELDGGNVNQGFDDWLYPMYAVGEGENIEFQNLCSVLKLNIIGNGEWLKSVKIESLDEGVYLSGTAVLDISSTRPTVRFTSDYEDRYQSINFRLDDYEDELVYLSNHKPVECQIVIPAQNYPSGLKITVVTDAGMMEVNTAANLTFKPSELREVPLLEYENEVSFAGNWMLVSHNDATPYIFSKWEGKYMVLKNIFLKEFSYMNISYGGEETYGLDYETHAWGTEQLTNTCVRLAYDGHSISVRHEDYYDVYFDPSSMEFFIMSQGVSPSDLPTTSAVASNDYKYLWNTADDYNFVRVYGQVRALDQRGFVLRMLDNYSIHVYTYDSYYLDSSMKEELNAIEVNDYVELYAYNTYGTGGLPELTDVRWSKVYKYRWDHYVESPEMIEDHYSSDFYNYIAVYGTVKKLGNSYWLQTDGGLKVYVMWPIINLNDYTDMHVMLCGFYMGEASDGIRMIAKEVLLPNGDGSTEDIIPDSDIVIGTR